MTIVLVTMTIVLVTMTIVIVTMAIRRILTKSDVQGRR